MVMRSIPCDEWDGFLDRFVRQHRHQPVTVAKSDLRDGVRIVERAAPLMAMMHDRSAHRIAITVGERPSGEVTHTLVNPDGVALEEPAEADEDPQVAVHLTGGGQHMIVRLERDALHP